jgi:dipeptidyl-peptidase-4
MCHRPLLWLSLLAAGFGLGPTPTPVAAQDRLKLMPGYTQYEKMRRDGTNAVKLGSLTGTWKDEGKAFEFNYDGQRRRFDAVANAQTVLSNAPGRGPRGPRRGEGERRERGRQFTSAVSPDGKQVAFYRDYNLWLAPTNTDRSNAVAITTEGNAKSRLKFGSASWVYGEELDQHTAIWWSPDSRRLAFYRFDESRVTDFYLQLSQTKLLSTLDTEAYPKAGGTNPSADLMIYELESRKTTHVDVRDGRPFDSGVGHYVYDVAWTKDGKELLFHRTNRRQNILELAAADATTGKCRVVLREQWTPSWIENSPELKFLKDGKRFIWASERTGWRNYYLYELSGRLVTTLTRHAFETVEIKLIDEPGNALFYTARSGSNPMKVQLHRVPLNGAEDVRLTDPYFHHTVDVAPDGRHFIDVAQTHDVPPSTVVRDRDGQQVMELARSDSTRFKRLGLRPVDLLRFKAADGQTELYGMLHYPSKFSPTKKYPLLVSVYAGPATTGARETFTLPSPLTELGFLVASFDSRSASGRGKEFLDAIYGRLGIVEIDDQAAAVRWLGERAYVDNRRVGIYGTSYGGTASILALLRYPDLFQAACASSPVTDFRNYDSIYTERYLGLPQENKAAYDAVSTLTYVKNLRGRLMLFYGTADNNVHPNNTMQLVQALQREGKSFDLQVGPDKGHDAVNRERMMEFFIENLVLRDRL